MKKIKIKDRDDITFSDREYLEDLLLDFDITPEELCYLLTQYESRGSINYEQGIKEILSEKIEDPHFSDLEEYIDENSYEPIYDIELFDDLESGKKPSDILQKAYYGSLNPGYHQYFSYDGKGNYKGYHDLNEMIDQEFLDWYYRKQLEDLLYDDDFKSDIINGTLQLIKKGY